MINFREIIRWAWLVVSLADFLASALAWLELRKKCDPSFKYLSRIMFADALRALVTVIGLYLFGINVQSRMWFLLLGLFSVMCQGCSTVKWLLYIRGVIDRGLLDLIHRKRP